MTPTNFQQQVYRLTAKVPRGRVTTYAIIAKVLRNPRATRAVGNALNKNPYAPQVPCHRVIRSTGEIGGFASGTKNKIKKLQQEGVVIKNNRLDLPQYLYVFTAKK